MIFGILKLVIWLAGVAVVVSFALPYFGYQVNMDYFDERKVACQEQLTECRSDLIKTGFEGAKETCDWKCVDPKLIIKKQDKDAILESETEPAN